MKLYRIILTESNRSDFLVPIIAAAKDKDDVVELLKEKHVLQGTIGFSTIEEVDMTKESILIA